MSVNLHLSIIVRGYDPRRTEAIQRAIREVVQREGLEGDLPPLVEGEDEGGRYLSARTDPDAPVIISRAYKWAPEFHDALREAAALANEGACDVDFDWEDADDVGDDLPDYESG
jgi:hypothetical protein